MKSNHRTARLRALLFLVFLNPDQYQPTDSRATESSTPVDSNVVATFLALPERSIESRRDQADELAKRARNTKNGPLRRASWQQATRADPSSTRYWLSLAETELMMGYDRAARTSLAAARVALDFTTGETRREAARDYSLGLAWWHYEMGQWEESLAWGRRALKYGAQLDGHLIVGLNNARFEDSWYEIREAGKIFFPLKSGGNRRADLSWCYLMFRRFNRWAFFEEDLAWWLHRSTSYYEHDLTRWRDYAQFCEENDSETMAWAYYEKSIDSLPIKEGGWITRKERTIPWRTRQIAPMPFWVNTDDGFVTGSLLAYSGYVHERMTASGNRAERVAWAERVEVAASRTEERYPSRPWPILWRSDALAILGRLDEASTEIARAREAFRRWQLDDPDLDRVQGHILLLQGKFAQAAPLIRAAAAALPQNASCWMDLGTVELRAGNDSAAREAFDRALELNGDLPMALYNRGLLKWREGDREEAQAEIERALEIVPDNSEISETLARLREAVDRGT